MLANLEARKQEKMDALKKLKEELAIKRQLAQRGIQREELSPEALQALMKDLEEQRRARREAREQKMMAKGTHHFFFSNPLCVCVLVRVPALHGEGVLNGSECDSGANEKGRQDFLAGRYAGGHPPGERNAAAAVRAINQSKHNILLDNITHYI
jgi:hypothetical protein